MTIKPLRCVSFAWLSCLILLTPASPIVFANDSGVNLTNLRHQTGNRPKDRTTRSRNARWERATYRRFPRLDRPLRGLSPAALTRSARTSPFHRLRPSSSRPECTSISTPTFKWSCWEQCSFWDRPLSTSSYRRRPFSRRSSILMAAFFDASFSDFTGQVRVENGANVVLSDCAFQGNNAVLWAQELPTTRPFIRIERCTFTSSSAFITDALAVLNDNVFNGATCSLLRGFADVTTTNTFTNASFASPARKAFNHSTSMACMPVTAP